MISSASSFGLPEKADHGRRRGLALGQAVDRVVHDDVGDVEVAADSVDEVPGPDREGVAVAAEGEHLEVGIADLDPGRDRHGAAVDRVEAVRRHKVRQATRAADARDANHVFGVVPLGQQRVVDGVQDAEIPTAGAPGRLLLALVIFERKLDYVRHAAPPRSR
jgi:hypothetical protein